MNIFPKVGERSIFFGKTGTGKTTAMLHMAKRFLGKHQIQLIATKEDKAILSMGYPVVTSISKIHEYKFPEYPFVIYYPNGAELGEPEILDAWCQWIYDRKRTVAIIDEMSQVAHSTHPKAGFLNLYTRGRSQEVTVLAGTQRPRGLPPVAYTEAENFYKFFLTDIKDRKRVAEMTHPKMAEQVADMHGFHFYNPKRSNNLFYIKSIRG